MFCGRQTETVGDWRGRGRMSSHPFSSPFVKQVKSASVRLFFSLFAEKKKDDGGATAEDLFHFGNTFGRFLPLAVGFVSPAVEPTPPQ